MELSEGLLVGGLSVAGSVAGTVIGSLIRSILHEYRISQLEKQLNEPEHGVRPRLHRHANILMKYGYRLRTVESSLGIDFEDEGEP